LLALHAWVQSTAPPSPPPLLAPPSSPPLDEPDDDPDDEPLLDPLLEPLLLPELDVLPLLDPLLLPLLDPLLLEPFDASGSPPPDGELLLHAPIAAVNPTRPTPAARMTIRIESSSNAYAEAYAAAVLPASYT
jgi:hypothetical protein